MKHIEIPLVRLRIERGCDVDENSRGSACDGSSPPFWGLWMEAGVERGCPPRVQPSRNRPIGPQARNPGGQAVKKHVNGGLPYLSRNPPQLHAMTATRPARTYFHIHLVSDSTGETLNAMARAVCARFSNVLPIEHIYALVRSQRQVERVLGEIADAPGVVLHTIVDEKLRARWRAVARSWRWPVSARWIRWSRRCRGIWARRCRPGRRAVFARQRLLQPHRRPDLCARPRRRPGRAGPLDRRRDPGRACRAPPRRRPASIWRTAASARPMCRWSPPWACPLRSRR